MNANTNTNIESSVNNMNTTTASRIMIFSTFSGLFIEENVVCKRVVKSIYTEVQDYDSLY